MDVPPKNGGCQMPLKDFRKDFKVFAPDDIGPETIIGGEARHHLELVPEYFNDFKHLILPCRPETVEEFKKYASGRRIILEVGAGKGRFISAIAAANPDAVCLGLETGLSLCGHSLDKAARRGCENVFMGWGDARATIPLLLEDNSVERAYLLFPDPWWKRKHAARRHGPVMAATIARVLKSGSFLVLKSDIEPYLEEMTSAFLSTGSYFLCSDSQCCAIIDALPQTDREVGLCSTRMRVFTSVLVKG